MNLQQRLLRGPFRYPCSELFKSATVVDLIATFLIFKFRNSKFALKEDFVNNKKNSQIAKFLRFKMIWSSAFEKNIYGSNIVQKFGPI